MSPLSNEKLRHWRLRNLMMSMGYRALKSTYMYIITKTMIFSQTFSCGYPWLPLPSHVFSMSPEALFICIQLAYLNLSFNDKKFSWPHVTSTHYSTSLSSQSGLLKELFILTVTTSWSNIYSWNLLQPGFYFPHSNETFY